MDKESGTHARLDVTKSHTYRHDGTRGIAANVLVSFPTLVGVLSGCQRYSAGSSRLYRSQILLTS